MKIALIGYGKMGKEIEKIAQSRNHEVIYKFDVNNINELTAENLIKADVAIEFTKPESAYQNFQKCFDAGIPVVSGTTGWLDKMDDIQKLCKAGKTSFFYASNFSIGVNIFFKLNQYLAKIMNQYSDYNVDIEEIHHTQKLDAPSGTAISLAEDLIENIERKTTWKNAENVNENEISILSKREGNVTGTHYINYHSEIDDITINHVAHNRKGFALGAVLAAEFIKNKTGYFTMNDLLKL